MSRRDDCPSCGSSTAFGDIKCFKCGYRPAWYPKNYVFDHIGLTKEQENNLYVPDDIEYNPPYFNIEALRWLYKYHIYKDTIKRHKIGYTPSKHRVFIPVFDSSETLKFYQLRALNPDDSIKYLTYGSKVDMWSLHPTTASRRLIICEDNISAIRLSKHDNAVALQGTSMPLRLLKHAYNVYDEFIVWTDPDRPGLLAKNKIIKQLTEEISRQASIDYWKAFCTGNQKLVFYINQRSIDKDPKCYTDNELEYILENELREVDI